MGACRPESRTSVASAGRWVLHEYGLPDANVDEFNAALFFGVPLLVVIIAVLVVDCAGILMLVRRLPEGERVARLVAVSVAMPLEPG